MNRTLIRYFGELLICIFIMSFNLGPIRNRAGMPTAVHKMLLGKFRSKNGLWTFMSDRAVSGDFSFINLMLTFYIVF